jgi:hypothetical protein
VNDGNCHGQADTSSWSCVLGTASISPVSCTPAGGTLVEQDPWKQTADVCDAKPGADCGPNQQCLPRGTGSYAGFICVYSPGDQSCPGDYSIHTLVYVKSKDDRKCAGCSCAAGPPTCIGADYEFFDDPFCLVGGKSAAAACVDFSGYTAPSIVPGWAFKRKSAGVVAGSCTPSGGQASGGMVGDMNTALTVCCRYPTS